MIFYKKRNKAEPTYTAFWHQLTVMMPHYTKKPGLLMKMITNNFSNLNFFFSKNLNSSSVSTIAVHLIRFTKRVDSPPVEISHFPHPLATGKHDYKQLLLNSFQLVDQKLHKAQSPE